jgi:hypothetical protein
MSIHGPVGVTDWQWPIPFEDLPIVIFIRELLPIEILLFQNCLFIFELDSNCNFINRDIKKRLQHI